MTHVPSRALTLAALLVAIWLPAHAERCGPPNVARVVIVPPAPHVTMEYRPPALACPATGACWMAPQTVPQTAPTEMVVCLTPGQEADALANAQ